MLSGKIIEITEEVMIQKIYKIETLVKEQKTNYH